MAQIRRAVLDTNVLVSAFVFGGRCRAVLRETIGKDRRVQLLVSDSLMGEFARVLSVKFGWLDARIAGALREVLEVSEVVATTKRISVVDDESDNRVLECAVDGEADFIITGDNHLLALGRHGSIKIVKPAEFLDRLAPE